MKLRTYLPFLFAMAMALPGSAVKLAGVHLDPPWMALLSGMAILGASFLLLWACDAVQADISQTLALAVVALIAVLPEYAVDMYFTWQAGRNPTGNYAHYAIANMTGANRLLIGVAWGLIALLYWFRRRHAVRLGHERRLELLFLGLATVYAFLIPVKGSLAWYDGVFFLGLYAAYLALAKRRPCVEVEAEGPAEALVHLPKAQRRAITAFLFIYACGAILANAAPFCEGLIGTGRLLHINEFLLVQWLAPIASEAPEFTVALMFAWRGQASMALGSLLSSKLNQWTLLVGMIPGVYAVSSGTLAHPLPMGNFQMQEILLTAAQSLLGIVMLASLHLGIGGALLLFVLFFGQLVLPQFLSAHPNLLPALPAEQVHPLFTGLYFAAAAIFIVRNRRALVELLHGAREAHRPPAAPCGDDQPPCILGDNPALPFKDCRACRWRQTHCHALPSEPEPKA